MVKKLKKLLLVLLLAVGTPMLLTAQEESEERNFSQRIDEAFQPIVTHIGNVLFWDPFEAVGIYDPIVYSDQRGVVATEPNPELNEVYFSQITVEDGSEVEEGQIIGFVNIDGNLTEVVAEYNGVINIEVDSETNLVDQVTGGVTQLATITLPKALPVLDQDGNPITKNIPIVVVWLILGAIYFTFKMKFINIRGFKHAIDLVAGKYSNPEDKGEVSHFQALATALSATVGLGNIAGVAVAVTLGGAGATFWMILAGLLGMSSKFVECTLGVKYRHIDEHGSVYGGPMYYLSKGLELRNKKVLGKVLAVIFAILCIGGSFGGGNMFQANQAFAQMASEFTFLQGQGAWFGIVLAVLVGIVIIGGIKSIAKVTDKIVPLMVGLYVTFAIIIILLNIGNIGEAFGAIISGALAPDAIKGGLIGVLVVGFQRAAFSNEAGVGSASIAHSASKTSEPVSEGIVALLEPFIDTVVVCTMTALVLIFTGFADGASGLNGSELTSAAFSSVFPWFKYVLIVAILLFAFSTMISWSYYGLKSWTYLFGISKASEYSYKAVFLIFIVVGSASSLGAVLDFSDMMILGMAFPNILGLLFLSNEVLKDLKSYRARVKSGEIRKFKE